MRSLELRVQKLEKEIAELKKYLAKLQRAIDFDLTMGTGVERF